MTWDDILSVWENKALFRFPIRLLADVNMTEESKRFLEVIGLPISAQVVFYSLTLLSESQPFVDKANKRVSVLMDEWNGSRLLMVRPFGGYIAVDVSVEGRIITFGSGDDRDIVFVNTDVIAFMQCLTLYEQVVRLANAAKRSLTGKPYVEYIIKSTDTLMAEMRAVDGAVTLDPDSFWPSTINDELDELGEL